MSKVSAFGEDVVICGQCGKKFVVPARQFEWEVTTEDDNIKHQSSVEFQCTCGNNISYKVNVIENPEGIIKKYKRAGAEGGSLAGLIGVSLV